MKSAALGEAHIEELERANAALAAQLDQLDADLKARDSLLEKALLTERFLRTGKPNRMHRKGFGTNGRSNTRIGEHERRLADLYETRLNELGFSYNEDP